MLSNTSLGAVPPLLLAIVAGLWCLPCAWGGEAPLVPYKVEISGVKDKGLLELLEAQSVCMQLKDRPPASLPQLQARVEKDRARFREVLLSLGYMEAEVDVEIRDEENPVPIGFTLTPGPRYRVGKVGIRFTVEDVPAVKPMPKALHPDAPASARELLKAEQAILNQLGDQGYPFAEIRRRSIEEDADGRHLNLDYLIDPGPSSLFGALNIQGLTSVRESHVRRYVDWRPGERYHQAAVRLFEDRLRASGLFAVVQVSPPTDPAEAEALDVNVSLRERNHRTIKLGASFETDIGPGIHAGWEHRNLFKNGEKFVFDARLSSIELAQIAKLRKNFFLHPDLALVLEQRFARDNPDAYDSLSLQGSVVLEMQLSGTNRLVSAGVSYKFSQVEQFGQTGEFQQLLFPVAFIDDARDHPLNATRGTYFQIWTSPYINTVNRDLSFQKSDLEGRTYFRIMRRPDLVAALRLKVGGIIGAARLDVAADDRFYAGGGGSVRGYGYQAVGESVDGTPVGGTSLLESALELRFRTGETLGWVAFVDGGNVYATSWPDVEALNLEFGAGLGVRYATGIGPVRLDLAVPVRPENGNYPLQVYISIGHAF